MLAKAWGSFQAVKVRVWKTLELFFSKAFHRKSQEDKKHDFLPLKWLKKNSGKNKIMVKNIQGTMGPQTIVTQDLAHN